MFRISAILAIMLVWSSTVYGALQIEEVEYRTKDTEMKGYLAHDDSISGKRPGVLVVHEWWGLNNYVRKRAEMLAELGYTALALDMYGQGKTADHPDSAREFSAAVKQNMEQAVKRFKAAMQLLQDQPSVNPEKIAAIGYCFGGGIVLEMARTGVDLDGVVSFHGSLSTEHPAEPGKIKAGVQAISGGADPMVTLEDIQAFIREMQQAGVEYQFVSYPGAKHAFTNPKADELGSKFNLPLAYDVKADRKSWQEMMQFLQIVFDE